jgi:tRNA threonylcarbamoyladenosine modification (KEOPS) complex Cgi121 subunit
MFAAFRQSIQDPLNLVNAYGKRAALFNPALVAGYPHLNFAQVRTDLAFRRGENIARDYNIEFLVRLSGRNQIERALEIGVQKSTYAGVMAEESSIEMMEQDLGHRDDSLLELTEEKEENIRDFFGVSGSGRILQKGIFEKIALLSIY